MMRATQRNRRKIQREASEKRQFPLLAFCQIVGVSFCILYRFDTPVYPFVHTP